MPGGTARALRILAAATAARPATAHADGVAATVARVARDDVD